jgi:alpha-glucosidase
MTHNSLYASARGEYVDSNPLANITIMGVPSAVSNLTLNGASLTSGWTYDAESRVLEVKELNNVTASGAWAADWVLKWS